MKDLTFNEVSQLNRTRAKDIRGITNSDFDLKYYGVALAGEVGELCNFIKKQYRDKVDNKTDQMLEIADIYTYLDLLSEQVGCTVDECLRLKWNQVSKKYGLSYRLPE